MNKLFALALLFVFSSVAYGGGTQFPKSIQLIVSQPTEIYHIGVGCWLYDEPQDDHKNISVYLNRTTDMSIKDTSDYCSIEIRDMTTSCEEDLQDYFDVISSTGICELRTYSFSHGSARGEALCKGQRSDVVNMIYELCSILLNAD